MSDDKHGFTVHMILPGFMVYSIHSSLRHLSRDACRFEWANGTASFSKDSQSHGQSFHGGDDCTSAWYHQDLDGDDEGEDENQVAEEDKEQDLDQLEEFSGECFEEEKKQEEEGGV